MVGATESRWALKRQDKLFLVKWRGLRIDELGGTP